jgi:hypothetical protein
VSTRGDVVASVHGEVPRENDFWVAYDDAFDRDLRSWVHRVYLQREQLLAERSRTAIEGLFDRERRLLTWLAAQLMVSIALLPWWGAWGVLGGLVVLYVGTFVSGAWTLRREARLTTTRSRSMVEQEAERAFAARPALDADARALLIRLMNLADLRPTQRSLHLLRQELRESLTVPTLVGWRFLHDLVDVVDGPEAVRLGASPRASVE